MRSLNMLIDDLGPRRVETAQMWITDISDLASLVGSTLTGIEKDRARVKAFRHELCFSAAGDLRWRFC
jgi:hypothetical protein